MALRQIKIAQSFTERNSGITEKYLNDVSKQKMVTKEEEVELAKKIKAGDKNALNTLVAANLRFAFSVAKQYQNKGLPIDDLVNEANLGLMKAALRFDETRGFKFISFAVWWIRQSIMEAIANNSRIVRLPLNKVGDLSTYGKAFSKLEQSFGRTPTIGEVAEYLGVDNTEIDTIEGHMFRHTSLDAKVFEDESSTVSDMMVDDSMGNPQDRLFASSLKIDIVRVFKVLTKTEQYILRCSFGLGCNPMSLEEIGEKMGYTKERIRQIRSKSIQKIKEKNRHHILKKYLSTAD